MEYNAGARGLHLVPAGARKDFARWQHEYGQVFLLPVEGETVLFRACTLNESSKLLSDDIRLQSEALDNLILYPKVRTVEKDVTTEGLELLHQAPPPGAVLSVGFADDEEEDLEVFEELWLPETIGGFGQLVRAVLRYSGFTDGDYFNDFLEQKRDQLRSGTALPEVMIGLIIARVWPTITPEVMGSWDMDRILDHLVRAELTLGVTLEQVINEVLSPQSAQPDTMTDMRRKQLEVMAKEAEHNPKVAAALQHELQMEEQKQQRKEMQRQKAESRRDAHRRVQKVQSQSSASEKRYLNFDEENKKISAIRAAGKDWSNEAY